MRGGGFAAILEHWSKLDMAVVGLFEPVSDSEVLSKETAPSMVKRLLRSGAVGDILGQFFDAEGALFLCGMEERLVGFGIGGLAKVRTVVCLSGGSRKIDGIVAAAKAGYFHVLVTDRLTAEGILDRTVGEVIRSARRRGPAGPGLGCWEDGETDGGGGRVKNRRCR